MVTAPGLGRCSIKHCFTVPVGHQVKGNFGNCHQCWPMVPSLVDMQNLCGRSLWQFVRRRVQLRCQPLCGRWYRSHTVCLCTARSAVSNTWGEQNWLWAAWRLYLCTCFLPTMLLYMDRDGDWTRFRLQRLYFVWVCRELQSFYWFAELLCSVHHKVRAWSTCCSSSMIISFLVCKNNQD